MTYARAMAVRYDEAGGLMSRALRFTKARIRRTFQNVGYCPPGVFIGLRKYAPKLDRLRQIIAIIMASDPIAQALKKPVSMAFCV
jgi:hypothetical protein